MVRNRPVENDPWGVTPCALWVSGMGDTCGQGIPAMVGWRQQGDPDRGRRSKQPTGESYDIPFLGKEGGDIPPNSLQLEFPRLSKPHVFGPVDSWPQL